MVSRQGNLVVEPKVVVPVERAAPAPARRGASGQGKPYGLSFRDISGGFTNTARGGPQAFKVLPILVYRVWVDGRPDELVRGVDLVGTPLAALSRIIAASDDYQTFNGYCGAESGFVPGVGDQPQPAGRSRSRSSGATRGATSRRVLPAPALRGSRTRRDAGDAMSARRCAGRGARWPLVARRRRGVARRRRSRAAPPPTPRVRVDAAAVAARRCRTSSRAR